MNYNYGQIKKEINRENYKKLCLHMFSNTISIIIIVLALALIISFEFPVVQYYGNSMGSAIESGSKLVLLKTTKIKRGDLVAFYVNNKLLVKRCIATSLETVDFDDNGSVIIENKILDEPYIKEKTKGNSDIKYPFKVPENKFFVLSDIRSGDIDSRNSIIGCISKEQIIGKCIFKI